MNIRSTYAVALTAALLAGVTAGPAVAANKALLIGLDTYADERLSFKVKGASGNDVEAVKDVLVSKLGFAAGDVLILRDEKAGKQSILTAIKDWLVKGTKPGERAFFYYAGHGYFQNDTSGDEKDGLDETLVPYDAKVTGKNKSPLAGMISDDELELAFGALKGRKISVIIDSGHSGTLTRAITVEARPKAEIRSPQLKFATRSIVVEPKLKKQKTEGVLINKVPPKGTLTTWSAVSSSQHALINTQGRPHGVFTKLYVEGIKTGRADLNKNGTITNAELLSYVTDGSAKYCKQHSGSCEMGLTPRLEPAASFGFKVITVAKAKVAQPHKPTAKLTFDVLSDYLAKGNVHGIKVEQIPPSPVYVGARDIRFRVISPHDGYLILLNLGDDGKLVHLFPNKHSRKHNRDGAVRAHAPLTVPDDYYGIKFNATAPSKGRIVALVTREKITLPHVVKTRSIEVIPRKTAAKSYLPELAAALNTPAHRDTDKTNTKAIDWSVATLRYEIKPRH